MLIRRVTLLGAAFSSLIAFADEPIMNMMPRCDNGWGVQMINEYRHENDLLLGDRIAYSVSVKMFIFYIFRGLHLGSLH